MYCDALRVVFSDLRKHFYTAPTNDRVPVGGQIQMPCLPPDGDPKPEIFWLKDGQEIERRADSNVILANDGSLIISSARVTDTGNYSCEARNVANRRKTDPAQISVYGERMRRFTFSGGVARACRT
uniref:Ig-like domain-containing protein n=1 Tax=Plectus sambesii TaxID=2011161 RepID=A0A914XP10_9BILA